MGFYFWFNKKEVEIAFLKSNLSIYENQAAKFKNIHR